MSCPPTPNHRQGGRCAGKRSHPHPSQPRYQLRIDLQCDVEYGSTVTLNATAGCELDIFELSGVVCNGGNQH